jgi:hypothetical protein
MQFNLEPAVYLRSAYKLKIIFIYITVARPHHSYHRSSSKTTNESDLHFKPPVQLFSRMSFIETLFKFQLYPRSKFWNAQPVLGNRVSWNPWFPEQHSRVLQAHLFYIEIGRYNFDNIYIILLIFQFICVHIWRCVYFQCKISITIFFTNQRYNFISSKYTSEIQKQSRPQI